MNVLGIDPGQQTGLALLTIGPQAPFTHRAMQVVTWPDPCVPPQVQIEMRAVYANQIEALAAQAERICVEGWEYQGPARARGIASQAEAFGRIRGILWPREIVRLRRTEVLAGLGLARNATKAAVRRAVVALMGGDAIIQRSWPEHAIDAAAVAIVGAGRRV
jgi:Holliday junction resolvasome RuvABC endonuclease subunit